MTKLTAQECREALAKERQYRIHVETVRDDALASAEVAEAEVLKLGSRLAEWIDRAHNAEADLLAVRLTLAGVIDERNDASAEVKRLRTALADCQQSEAYARSEMARLQRIVNQSSK